ncbi:hypothetical protein TNCV_2855211 [Trichonephila clavipes]|nr:hypothetical protein TNCV_2855211 [Trichonephila clavipes]
MTLSSPTHYQKFLVIKKISTPCEWISTMRQLIAVTPDSADRKPVDTGSYTRWNHAYGSYTEELVNSTDSKQEEKSWTATSIAHDEIQWKATVQQST